MFKKLLKSFIIFTKVLGIFLIFSLLFFIWKLHTGPISINKAIPYIIDAINLESTGTNIDIEDAYLFYDTLDHPISVRLVGVDVFDNSDTQIARLPELLIDFSIEGLIKGELFPKSVTVPSASLRLRLTDDGRIMGYSSTEDSHSNFDIGKLIKTILSSNYNPYFKEIRIKNSEFQLSHKDIYYELPEIDIEIEQKNRSYNITINGLAMIGVQAVNFKLDAIYDRLLKTSEVVIDVSPFNPKLFESTNKFSFLDSINITLTGKLSAFLRLSEFKDFNDLNFIERASFELSGHNGVLRLPFLDDEELYEIKSLSAKGQADKGLSKLDIGSIKIQAKEGTVTAKVDIKGLNSLLTSSNLENIEIDTTAKVAKLDAKHLKKYWPQSISYNVRKWIDDNISAGTYSNADFKMSFKGTKRQTIEPTLIKGTLDYKNATISYIEGMPLVKKAKGRAYINLEDITVLVESGETNGLQISSGKLDFTKLREAQTFANIQLSVSGALQDALMLIDNKPFYYMQDLPIKPTDITGNAIANIELFFPLDMDLTVDKVDVNISADLQKVKAKNIASYIELNNSNFGLKVDNDLLVLVGKGDLNELSTEIIFKKYFTPQEYPYEYQLLTNLSTDLITDYYPDYSFIINFISGKEIPTKATIKLDSNQQGFIQVNADIINTTLDLGFIGWHKESAKAGVLDITIPIKEQEKKIQIHISDKKENDIKGFINLDKDNNLQQISFDEIKGAKTEASLNFNLQEEDIITLVTGKSLNIKNLLDNNLETQHFSFLSRKDEKGEIQESKENKSRNIFVKIDLDKLSFDSKGAYRNVKGNIFISDTLPDKITVAGVVGKASSPVEFSLIEQDNYSTYTLQSNNAGANLRVLGLIDNIKSGKLNINGKILENKDIIGNILIKDFYLLKAPNLVKLLSLASFTGIVDSLEGNGVKMERFEIPYEYKNDIISISEAYTYGSGFGLTGKGEINLAMKTLSINGSIVPAYTLNSILSKIPLFGTLFAGEKGSGFLNFSYGISGLIDSPSITVNPLAILTPGAIKTILEAGKAQSQEE